MTDRLYLAPATRGGGVYIYFERTVLAEVESDFYFMIDASAQAWIIKNCLYTLFEQSPPLLQTLSLTMKGGR